jgi:serine/threonine protein kinase
MKRVIRVKALGDTPYFISEEPGDIIGRGSYGRVIRAYSKTNLSKRYVAKIFELSNLK